jgi:hypothetical protein
MARLSFCKQAQCADPVLLIVTHQIARNHVRSGRWLRWKIVPAVTEA